MKFYNKIFIMTVLPLFALYPQCESLLSVKTDNDSANIILNDKTVGKGSLSLKLEKGNYILKVTGDPLTWNTVSYRDSFVVADCGDNKEFSYSFNGRVYLQTDPQDSYVYSKDSLIGFTPLYISRDIPLIRLSKPGYSEKEIKINDVIKNGVIPLEHTGSGSSELFIKKDLFLILVGTAAVLGGVTAYFKLKADDYFENYQFTGNASMLNKTRNYDLISGITFGALQVNFGLLIYYFLTD